MKFEVKVSVEENEFGLLTTIKYEDDTLLGSLQVPGIQNAASEIYSRESRDALAGVILLALTAAVRRAKKSKT
jgi:hypothetical protein